MRAGWGTRSHFAAAHLAQLWSVHVAELELILESVLDDLLEAFEHAQGAAVAQGDGVEGQEECALLPMRPCPSTSVEPAPVPALPQIESWTSLCPRLLVIRTQQSPLR